MRCSITNIKRKKSELKKLYNWKQNINQQQLLFSFMSRLSICSLVNILKAYNRVNMDFLETNIFINYNINI